MQHRLAMPLASRVGHRPEAAAVAQVTPSFPTACWMKTSSSTQTTSACDSRWSCGRELSHVMSAETISDVSISQ